jgi:integrase
MSQKFNEKVFKGERIYREILGQHLIYRVWSWCDSKKRYEPPIKGKAYRARKYELGINGKRTRVECFFDNMDDARLWQTKPTDVLITKTAVAEVASGPTFENIVTDWKKRRFSVMESSTQVRYLGLLRKHFEPLLSVPMCIFTPQVIDQWIDGLKSPSNPTMQTYKRLSFRHEVNLLRTILKYYEDYTDDPNFRFPFKKRHMDASKLNRVSGSKPKDMTVEEFWRFNQNLRMQSYGEILGPLSVVQYFQALRISEIAALSWEGVRFDFKNPSKSRLFITQKVVYLRSRGVGPYIEAGFKNQKANGGVKELPLFPEAYEALRELWYLGAKGLVFKREGKVFSYRQLQHPYDTALKAANLPYTGTHTMRHGGTRNLFNEDGDLSVAQQLLGNTSMQSTLVYAKRSAGALTKVCEAKWKKHEEVGSNWEQEAIGQKKT